MLHLRIPSKAYLVIYLTIHSFFNSENGYLTPSDTLYQLGNSKGSRQTRPSFSKCPRRPGTIGHAEVHDSIHTEELRTWAQLKLSCHHRQFQDFLSFRSTLYTLGLDILES